MMPVRVAIAPKPRPCLILSTQDQLNGRQLFAPHGYPVLDERIFHAVSGEWKSVLHDMHGGVGVLTIKGPCTKDADELS